MTIEEMRENAAVCERDFNSVTDELGGNIGFYMAQNQWLQHAALCERLDAIVAAQHALLAVQERIAAALETIALWNEQTARRG